MLIDLLNTDNYVSYNVKIAEALGLNAAVYITELININNKAYLKEKLDSEGFFTVDRKYVTKRTTLDATMQRDLDKALVKLQVLEVSSVVKDKIKLDLGALAQLITGTDVKKLSEIADVVAIKSDKKKTQKEKIVDSLKANILETNEELRAAYFGWIDTVFAKQGWMSKKSVTEGQAVINAYSNHDLDLALKILDIADQNAYRDMQWAVTRFEKDYKRDFYQKHYDGVNNSQKPCIVEKDVVVSDEVF